MNNRELATFILAGAGAMLVVTIQDTRRMLPSLARQLLLSKITPLLVAFAATEAGAIWLAREASLWNLDLTSAAVLWFLAVGFVWFLNLNDAGKDRAFFKRRFLETLGVSALLEFFVNAAVMPIPVELVSQIFLLLVVGMNVVASRDPQYKPVAKLTSSIMVLATLGLLTYSVVHLLDGWGSLDKRELAGELLMPVWMTAAGIPVLYAVACYMGYESLFVQMSFSNDHDKPAFRARLGVIVGLRGSLVDVAEFRGVRARDAAQSRTVRQARAAVCRYKEERAADLAARTTVRQRLVQNAGLKGVAEDGLVLDRREFAATKEALRWLATCHMGWYRNEDRSDEYRSDLLDALRGSHKFEFESGEGIFTKVRQDRQAWFAYRRTPSGHVFGIGASGPPPSQWLYDAPVPPSGYPSQKSENWTDVLNGDRPEWMPEPAT